MQPLSPLQLLMPEANGRWEPLDDFVSERLFEAGFWRSPGCSDGLSKARVIEDGPDRVRITGQIWEIEHQTLHSFWLDVVREGTCPNKFDWTMYLELDASKLTPRQVRNAYYVIEDPGQVAWRLVVSGHAVAQESRLVAIDGK